MTKHENSLTGIIAITGNTYPVKDQIKALGGHWNADRNWPYYYLRSGWLVEPDGSDRGQRCWHQAGPFPADFTVAEAEQWLKEQDIRGSVREG